MDSHIQYMEVLEFWKLQMPQHLTNHGEKEGNIFLEVMQAMEASEFLESQLVVICILV